MACVSTVSWLWSEQYSFWKCAPKELLKPPNGGAVLVPGRFGCLVTRNLSSLQTRPGVDTPSSAACKPAVWAGDKHKKVPDDKHWIFLPMCVHNSTAFALASMPKWLTTRTLPVHHHVDNWPPRPSFWPETLNRVAIKTICVRYSSGPFLDTRRRDPKGGTDDCTSDKAIFADQLQLVFSKPMLHPVGSILCRGKSQTIDCCPQREKQTNTSVERGLDLFQCQSQFSRESWLFGVTLDLEVAPSGSLGVTLALQTLGIFSSLPIGFPWFPHQKYPCTSKLFLENFLLKTNWNKDNEKETPFYKWKILCWARHSRLNWEWQWGACWGDTRTLIDQGATPPHTEEKTGTWEVKAESDTTFKCYCSDTQILSRKTSRTSKCQSRQSFTESASS